MKIIQVVPSIEAEASGPSYSVPSLCAGLAHAGGEVSLYCVGKKPLRDFCFRVVECAGKSFPHPQLGRSPEMLESLRRECMTADVIHNNSLWMLPNIYPAVAKRGTRCKLVTQPRGTLSAWALRRSSWKKRLIGVCGQYAAMRRTDLWVATSQEEYNDIRRLGYRQPIVILPNGVDVPASVRPKDERRRLVFLSRIHPTKGVDVLLRAWRNVQDEFGAWDLWIAGPKNGYAQQMEALGERLGCRRCQFVGEFNGLAKQDLYGGSECLVLPTHSENFGMVVAEALANGTAVICSKGAPWAGLNDYGCGAWIDIGVEPLIAAFRKFLAKPRQEFIEMGIRGREWMRREFSWDKIGSQMLLSYEWLLGRGDKPQCVWED